MPAPNQHFYERALAAYNDRLGPVVTRLRALTVLTLILAGTTTVSTLAAGYFGYLVATRPVEIVRIQDGAQAGMPQLAGVSVTALSEKDRALVEQALGSYIKDLKTVTADADFIVQGITKAQKMSARPVIKYIKDYFKTEDANSPTSPFYLMNKYRVTVDVKTLHLITGQTYRVDWTETYTSADTGAPVRTERWNSTISFGRATPEELAKFSAAQRVSNPLGLVITGLEWSKEQ